jgi:hypothetical protein
LQPLLAPDRLKKWLLIDATSPLGLRSYAPNLDRTA